MSLQAGDREMLPREQMKQIIGGYASQPCMRGQFGFGQFKKQPLYTP